MRESVVITGIGVVSAAGLGRKNFEESLRNSLCGVRPATLETEDGKFGLISGSVDDSLLPAGIEPRRHLNFKHMSRSGLMVCAAANMAAKDAQFEPDDEGREQTGIVMGTAFGGIQSMLRFNSDVRSKGPNAVNPIIFPDTVSNAPAGYAAISFGLMGMNATLSRGFSSGLTAIRMAYEQVASGKLRAVFAGGYDELIPHLCQFWSASGQISMEYSGNHPESLPFGSTRNGFYPGEGAVVVLLEQKGIAAQRGAPMYAELLGFGVCGADDESVAGRRNAMCAAIEEAAIGKEDIGAVFSAGNGSLQGDRDESAAIEAAVGSASPVCAIKAFTGESMAAAGPSSVAAACWALREGVSPGIPGLIVDHEEIRIDVSSQAVILKANRCCLVNASGVDAGGESIVIGAVNQ